MVKLSSGISATIWALCVAGGLSNLREALRMFGIEGYTPNLGGWMFFFFVAVFIGYTVWLLWNARREKGYKDNTTLIKEAVSEALVEAGLVKKGAKDGKGIKARPKKGSEGKGES